MTLTTVDAFEIELGSQSNTMTTIRNMATGSVLTEVATAGVLSETDLWYYWASWDNGLIQV